MNYLFIYQNLCFLQIQINFLGKKGGTTVFLIDSDIYNYYID